jgi:DnaJ-class molecular chaperone
MTYEEIRQLCRQRMEERSQRDADERDTLLPCPRCDGVGLIEGNSGGLPSYRKLICPYCNGNGHTDSAMIKLHRDHQKKGI